jgi:hypothetical protein
MGEDYSINNESEEKLSVSSEDVNSSDDDKGELEKAATKEQ